MRILLTGASGEIGAPLISRLQERQHEVHAISRLKRPEYQGSVQWIQADICDPKSLDSACQCEPQVVVHMAAATHSVRTANYYAVNVQGTLNLIEALSNVTPSRFIYVSTRAIGSPGGAYAESKEKAEQVVRRSGLQWTILRPAEVYGSGGNDPVLSLASDLRRRRFVPILGDGSHRLCPVLAEDVAEALIRAVEFTPASNMTYVLAGPQDFTYLELVRELERIQGLPRRLEVRIPITVAEILVRGLAVLGVGRFVPDQIQRLLLDKSTDSSAAKRDLQFEPRPLNYSLPLLLRRNTVL